MGAFSILDIYSARLDTEYLNRAEEGNLEVNRRISKCVIKIKMIILMVNVIFSNKMQMLFLFTHVKLSYGSIFLHKVSQLKLT